MTANLIERLEKATEPSIELDHAIMVAVGGESISYPPGEGLMTTDECLGPPEYTGSVDVAVTLVPEGWEWLVSNRARAPHAGRAFINNRELQLAGISGLAKNPKYRGEETTAATPAIAVCIAALRARAFP